MLSDNLKLIGFARGNGDKVHAIMTYKSNKKNSYTLCSINTKNKRIMNSENNPEFKSIECITCAKCQRTAFYRSQLPNQYKSQETIEIEQEKYNEDTVKEQINELKNNIQEEKQQNNIVLEVNDININTQSNLQQEKHNCECNGECKNNKTEIINKIIEPKFNIMIRDIAENFQRGDVFFYAKMKSDYNYKIKHRGSNTIFFDGIRENIILQALSILNNMNSQWDGKHCIPDDFIIQSKMAMIAAFKSIGKDYPESLEKIAKKHRYIACKKNKQKKNKIKILRKRLLIPIKKLKKQRLVIKHKD